MVRSANWYWVPIRQERLVSLAVSSKVTVGLIPKKPGRVNWWKSRVTLSWVMRAPAIRASFSLNW
ncbi:hypothetical protein D3C86_2156950 [compost metagenome]